MEAVLITWDFDREKCLEPSTNTSFLEQIRLDRHSGGPGEPFSSVVMAGTFRQAHGMGQCTSRDGCWFTSERLIYQGRGRQQWLSILSRVPRAFFFLPLGGEVVRFLKVV